MRARRLTVTGYVDWVLGERRDRSAPFIVTEIDRRSGALLARNHYVAEAHHRVGFFAVSEPLREHLVNDAGIPKDRIRVIPPGVSDGPSISLSGIVGSTIVYAHMQACGLVNDHLTTCFRYEAVREMGRKL